MEYNPMNQDFKCTWQKNAIQETLYESDLSHQDDDDADADKDEGDYDDNDDDDYTHAMHPPITSSATHRIDTLTPSLRKNLFYSKEDSTSYSDEDSYNYNSEDDDIAGYCDDEDSYNNSVEEDSDSNSDEEDSDRNSDEEDSKSTVLKTPDSIHINY